MIEISPVIKDDDLLSIHDAIAKRITRLRLPHWVCPEDHIEIDIDRTGHLGPWVKLWSPLNEVIGAPNPQMFLSTSFDDKEINEACWNQYKEKTDAV